MVGERETVVIQLLSFWTVGSQNPAMRSTSQKLANPPIA